METWCLEQSNVLILNGFIVIEREREKLFLHFGAGLKEMKTHLRARFSSFHYSHKTYYTIEFLFSWHYNSIIAKRTNVVSFKLYMA